MKITARDAEAANPGIDYLTSTLRFIKRLLLRLKSADAAGIALQGKTNLHFASAYGGDCSLIGAKFQQFTDALAFATGSTFECTLRPRPPPAPVRQAISKRRG